MENGKGTFQREPAEQEGYMHIKKTYLLFHTNLLPWSLFFFTRRTMYHTITAFHSFYEPTVILFF